MVSLVQTWLKLFQAENKESDSKKRVGIVPFLLKGSLSPAKQKKTLEQPSEKEENEKKPCGEQPEKREEAETKLEIKTPEASTSNSRKVSLG